MIDPYTMVFLVVITVCVPAVAYLIPQDPAVVRLVAAVMQRRRHRRLRRWVSQQRRGAMSFDRGLPVLHRPDRPNQTGSDRANDRSVRPTHSDALHHGETDRRAGRGNG